MAPDQALAMLNSSLERVHERLDEHLRDHDGMSRELAAITQKLDGLPCKRCLEMLAQHEQVFQQVSGAKRLVLAQWAIAGTVGGLVAAAVKYFWK